MTPQRAIPIAPPAQEPIRVKLYPDREKELLLATARTLRALLEFAAEPIDAKRMLTPEESRNLRAFLDEALVPFQGAGEGSNAASPPPGAIIINDRIRVLEHGANGWGVVDDDEEEAPLYPTREQAILFAAQRAVEKMQEAAEPHCACNDAPAEVGACCDHMVPVVLAPPAPNLVAVLEEAGEQIEYLHGKFQPTGSGEAVLARIRAAVDQLKARPQWDAAAIATLQEQAAHGVRASGRLAMLQMAVGRIYRAPVYEVPGLVHSGISVELLTAISEAAKQAGYPADPPAEGQGAG